MDESEVSAVGDAVAGVLQADLNESAEPNEFFSPVRVQFPINLDPAFRPPSPPAMAARVEPG